MNVSTTSPSARTLGDERMRLRHGGTPAECDLCGRFVRHENGFERVRRGDDGYEIVLVCRDCELGAD